MILHLIAPQNRLLVFDGFSYILVVVNSAVLFVMSPVDITIGFGSQEYLFRCGISTHDSVEQVEEFGKIRIKRVRLRERSGAPLLLSTISSIISGPPDAGRATWV